MSKLYSINKAAVAWRHKQAQQHAKNFLNALAKARDEVPGNIFFEFNTENGLGPTDNKRGRAPRAGESNIIHVDELSAALVNFKQPENFSKENLRNLRLLKEDLEILGNGRKMSGGLTKDLALVRREFDNNPNVDRYKIVAVNNK